MAPMDEARIRALVRRVVLRTVGASVPSGPGDETALIGERELADVPSGSRFEAPAGALITPLARQAAMERGISIVRSGSGATPAAGLVSPISGPFAARAGLAAGKAGKAVAIGTDHGGYEMKEMLKEHLAKLGYSVIDCGTEGKAAVDYPDFALAVAELVAQGSAWRGIVVDGAGIGSCMAANKVPGIRAAMCYDEATAVNSRAHNDANVLALGAGLIGAQLGRQIVETWLKTPAGAGRHARRVAKIMDIEARFSRSRHERGSRSEK